MSWIGGVMQVDDYTETIETPGLDVVELRGNPEYEVVSDRAQNACQAYRREARLAAGPTMRPKPERFR